MCIYRVLLSVNVLGTDLILYIRSINIQWRKKYTNIVLRTWREHTKFGRTVFLR